MKGEARKFRLLVALDPAAPNAAALEAIGSIAAGEHAELRGLFVEDINLLRLAGLPCAREVTTAGAVARALERRRLERQIRAQASRVRRSFERAASVLGLPHSFHVTRGEVLSEVERAASEADVLVVSRAHRSAGSRSWMGITIHHLAASGPRTVVFVQGAWRTGRTIVAVSDQVEKSDRALRVAARLARQEDLQLAVATTALDADATQRVVRSAASHLGGAHEKVQYLHLPVIDAASLLQAVRVEDARALVLPRHLVDLDLDRIRVLLQRMESSLIVVGEDP